MLRRTALALAVMLPAGARAVPMYTAVDIGNIGGQTVTGEAINASGQVTGNAFTADDVVHPFVYSNGTITDISAVTGDAGTGAGINASGQVATSGQFGSDVNSGLFVYRNGTATPIATGASTSSSASGINAAGQVAGKTLLPGNADFHATIFYQGQLTDLGVLAGGTTSDAAAINAGGMVAGTADVDGASHAMYYAAGAMHDLGVATGFDQSAATAINDAGTVVGYEYTDDYSRISPFEYRNGVTTLLDMGGTASNVVWGINARNQIVGYGINPDNSSTAFVYEDGRAYDLNALLATPMDAVLNATTAINDVGQIVATGSDGHTYLLTETDGAAAGNGTEVPEPQSMAFAGLALAGLLTVGSRTAGRR